MKKYPFLLIFLLWVGCSHTPSRQEAVFQNAPINALLAGCYSGTMPVRELKKHGDFGIGTLDALDGEMVALDHDFYQIKSDGKVYRLKGEETSPFATLVFFNSVPKWYPEQKMSLEALEAFIDGKVVSENLIYAIKVEGKFPELKIRSAARQSKPFPLLKDAIKDQKIFELKDQEGTLIGFRFPSYVEGINVPGYHFHFLSKDKTLGGHVLDLQVLNPGIQIDTHHAFSMKLPANQEFLQFHFQDDAKEAIQAIEK